MITAKLIENIKFRDVHYKRFANIQYANIVQTLNFQFRQRSIPIYADIFPENYGKCLSDQQVIPAFFGIALSSFHYRR